MATKTKKSRQSAEDDPFKGCVLAEKARRGELPEYYYTPNGLPKLRAKSVPGWSPFFEEDFLKAFQKAMKSAQK